MRSEGSRDLDEHNIEATIFFQQSHEERHQQSNEGDHIALTRGQTHGAVHAQTSDRSAHRLKVFLQRNFFLAFYACMLKIVPF